jgi:amino acid transporter
MRNDASAVEAGRYDYDVKRGDENEVYSNEPVVLGASTVAEASGRGGDTHRGLKSRHIQFL